jgi:hypothetical protein
MLAVIGTSGCPKEHTHRRKMTAREIITGTTVKVPPSGDALVNVLQKRAPYSQSETSGRGVRR